jgi:hypothetical protein
MQANKVSMLAERVISGSRASTSRPGTGDVVQQRHTGTVASDALCGRHPIAMERHSPRTLVQPSWTEHSERGIGHQVSLVCHRSGFTPAMAPSQCRYACDRASQSRSQLRETALWSSAATRSVLQQPGATARLPARCTSVTAHSIADLPPGPRIIQQQRRHTQRSTRR